jgi:hypothetical protein
MMPPEIESIDFSEAHFLDHTPFTRYCRSLPGGARRHLAYAWMMIWRDRVMAPVDKIRCARGDHHWVLSSHYDHGSVSWSGNACLHCGARDEMDY